MKSTSIDLVTAELIRGKSPEDLIALGVTLAAVRRDDQNDVAPAFVFRQDDNRCGVLAACNYQLLTEFKAFERYELHDDGGRNGAPHRPLRIFDFGSANLSFMTTSEFNLTCMFGGTLRRACFLETSQQQAELMV